VFLSAPPPDSCCSLHFQPQRKINTSSRKRRYWIIGARNKHTHTHLSNLRNPLLLSLLFNTRTVLFYTSLSLVHERRRKSCDDYDDDDDGEDANDDDDEGIASPRLSREKRHDEEKNWSNNLFVIVVSESKERERERRVFVVIVKIWHAFIFFTVVEWQKQRFRRSR